MISKELIEQLGKKLADMPAQWDGRSAILEMRDADYPHWRQMEWIGFYSLLGFNTPQLCCDIEA